MMKKFTTTRENFSDDPAKVQHDCANFAGGGKLKAEYVPPDGCRGI
jgi:hypothetical protein